MRRVLAILCVGVLAGVLTHVAYFQWQRPVRSDAGTTDLAWMRDELNLTDAQFTRIVSLHQESSKQLRGLAVQILAMQEEMKAFEETRRMYDRVDFVEFARFVDNYRRISQTAEDSTRGLVLATADVMTPQQRAHYLELVQPLVPPRDRFRSAN